jgi:uncharacterized RDD family membrane protein YckC
MEAAAHAAGAKGALIFIIGFFGFPVALGLFLYAAYKASKQPAWRWPLIDALVFVAAWIAAVIVAGASPPLSFMSEYSVEEFVIYIRAMLVMTAILFVVSVISFLIWGGSVGKRAAGYRTVREDGSPLGWREALVRALLLYALGILILAPGPLLGYLFGDGSQLASLAVLFLALGVWLWCVVRRERAQPPPGELARTQFERLLGLKTIASAVPGTAGLR